MASPPVIFLISTIKCALQKYLPQIQSERGRCRDTREPCCHRWPRRRRAGNSQRPRGRAKPCLGSWCSCTDNQTALCGDARHVFCEMEIKLKYETRQEQGVAPSRPTTTCNMQQPLCSTCCRRKQPSWSRRGCCRSRWQTGLNPSSC